MTLDSTSAIAALTELDGIGDSRAIELYETFGSLTAIQDAPDGAFDDFHYVDAETRRQFETLDDLAAEWHERFEEYQDRGIDVIGYGDESYPDSLRAFHAPPIIYARGDVTLLSEPSVSISGSRAADDHANEWTHHLAGDLATEGLVVVSGGAAGVDTAAHRGTLSRGGTTIVVFGTGLDRPYPEENAEVFEEVVDQGGLLISHRRPTAGPRGYAFRQRNETISALSRAVVIVATDGSGGTMAQHRDAISQGKAVFVPDPSHGFEPRAGIETILDDGEGTAVKSSGEIVEWFESGDDAPDRAPSGNEDGGQRSLDDWG